MIHFHSVTCPPPLYPSPLAPSSPQDSPTQLRSSSSLDKPSLPTPLYQPISARLIPWLPLHAHDSTSVYQLFGSTLAILFLSFVVVRCHSGSTKLPLPSGCASVLHQFGSTLFLLQPPKPAVSPRTSKSATSSWVIVFTALQGSPLSLSLPPSVGS